MSLKLYLARHYTLAILSIYKVTASKEKLYVNIRQWQNYQVAKLKSSFVLASEIPLPWGQNFSIVPWFNPSFSRMGAKHW